MKVMLLRKEENVLFNDALIPFSLFFLFYFVYMALGHGKGPWARDSKTEKLLKPLHGLLFPISNRGSFTSTIP